MSRPEDLFPLVYDELKRIARRHRRAAGSGDTLSTTELVHEAYLRLARAAPGGWRDRAHFFATASRAMRHLLVDFARRRKALKRGGDLRRVSLGGEAAALELEVEEMLALDVALDRLDAMSPRLRQVVELRFFAGLPEAEIAGTLGVTTRTVERDWTKARLFLLRELDGLGPGAGVPS